MTPFTMTDGSATKNEFSIPIEDVAADDETPLENPNFESDKSIDLKEDPENKIQEENEVEQVSFSKNCNFEFLLISF